MHNKRNDDDYDNSFCCPIRLGGKLVIPGGWDKEETQMNQFRDFTIGMAVLYVVTNFFLGWGFITDCRTVRAGTVEQCTYTLGELTWPGDE